MTDLKSIIIPFLIGGTVISGVKYASSHIKNPAVAFENYFIYKYKLY